MKWLDDFRSRLLLIGFIAANLIGGKTTKADFVFGEPVNLGPPVNSSYNEFDISVSTDGLSLFFESNRTGGFGAEDLWIATRASTKDLWGNPENLGEMFNSAQDDADSNISADGLSLYFRSNRPSGFGREDLWVSMRTTPSDAWSQPVNLGPTVNSNYDESDPSISVDGLTLYFSEWGSPQSHPRPSGYGGSDIWVCTRPTKETPWGEPVNLGSTVNGASDDYMQGISADGLTLFFASNRPGGSGSDDLYITKRLTTSGSWSNPINLGPIMNSSTWDLNPELSYDGSILYFDSMRSHGQGGFDLWQASIILIVDFNGDGIVDAEDMCIIVDHWGEDYSLCDIGPMPWGDGVVDVEDLKVLAKHLFQEVNDPTLVAHWTLDETEDLVVADSAGENDGYALGNPVWQPDGGQVGGALLFDGIDDFISAPTPLNPADAPFSIFAWIKGGSPGQVILSQTGGANWLYADSAEGKLMSELKGPGRSGPLLSQIIITDGQWHRVGLVWDGSKRMLYVDSAMVAEDTQNGLTSSSGGLYIGCGKGMESGTFFSGLIDDIRIYNRAVAP